MKKAATKTLNALVKNTTKTVSINIGEVDGVQISMEVKKYLSAEEFIKFVAEMADAQFTENDEFQPYLESIAFDINLCKYYTNLSLPEELPKQYVIIHQLEIKEKILDAISNSEQYKSLLACIREVHNYTRAQKTGITATLKGLLGDFDVKKTLEMAATTGFDVDSLGKPKEFQSLISMLGKSEETELPTSTDIPENKIIHLPSPGSDPDW